MSEQEIAMDEDIKRRLADLQASKTSAKVVDSLEKIAGLSRPTRGCRSIVRWTTYVFVSRRNTLVGLFTSHVLASRSPHLACGHHTLVGRVDHHTCWPVDHHKCWPLENHPWLYNSKWSMINGIIQETGRLETNRTAQHHHSQASCLPERSSHASLTLTR